jgi:hypothetical protein
MGRASTAEPGWLVIATTRAPCARAPVAARTRSSLAPDWLMTRAAACASATPAPKENTEGGSEVTGRPNSRITS